MVAMPSTACLSLAAPMSSDAGQASLLTAALFTILSLTFLALGVLGVVWPYKVARVQARMSRAMARFAYGPDWQQVMERLWAGKYADYLSRAPEDPQAFPFQARFIRIYFVVWTLVASLLSLACCLLLINSLAA